VKVALVIGTLERGGSERQIVELVRATHPDRAECVVICQGKEGPLAGEVRATGAKVIALGLEGAGSPRGVGRFAHGLWRFAWVLKRERPDVVYAFLFWGYVIALPLAALVVPRACRIQARRALPEADVPGKSIFKPLRWIADLCSHGAIVNSLEVGRAVARHEPALAGRMWVVPNGVRGVNRRSRRAGAMLTIVCVANLNAYKGHATLLAAVGRLRPEGWSLLLVGEGPERSSIEQTIAAANLRERVIVLGRRLDVHDILDTADLLVLPSYSEGMPNAVLEAMAHGLPVVASDVGGVRSLLGSGAGIVVGPRDESALTDALQRLIDDPSLRSRMGEKGGELARGRLSVDAMRDGTLSVISDIRAGRARRSERTWLSSKWWT
jgi:glycosyltransferase involved in cell wall biosynthesis